MQKNKSLSLKQQVLVHINFHLPIVGRQADVICSDVYKEV